VKHAPAQLLQSSELGRFQDVLGFDVLGSDRAVNLPVSGVCDYPRVSSDYRAIFARKVSSALRMHDMPSVLACKISAAMMAICPWPSGAWGMPELADSCGGDRLDAGPAARWPLRPRSQAKARPPTPSVARQFIIGSGVFEFGPLLLGKDPSGYGEGTHPDHTARLRITNNGMFPADVSLGLRSRLPPEPGSQAAAAPTPSSGKASAGAKPAAGGKGAAAAATAASPQLEGVFMLSHQALSLAVDETQEISLYAFPQKVHRDKACGVAVDVGRILVLLGGGRSHHLPRPALPTVCHTMNAHAELSAAACKHCASCKPPASLTASIACALASRVLAQEEEAKDELVIRVRDNPEPIIFPLSVFGTTPSVTVRLDEPELGPGPGPEQPATEVAPSLPPAKPKTPPKGGKAAGKDASPAELAPAANKLLAEGMVFERLLLGKREAKHMIIYNPGDPRVEHCKMQRADKDGQWDCGIGSLRMEP
jgi:hypothetical protein